jgi:DNA-binding phage protein
MALTRNFRDTVRDRAQRDAKFRRALLEEAITCMIADDMETGRSIMRNYINATVGFPELAKKTHIGKNSLMRMFGPKGNPSASHLFNVIHVLQEREGISLAVHAA